MAFVVVEPQSVATITSSLVGGVICAIIRLDVSVQGVSMRAALICLLFFVTGCETLNIGGGPMPDSGAPSVWGTTVVAANGGTIRAGEPIKITVTYDGPTAPLTFIFDFDSGIDPAHQEIVFVNTAGQSGLPHRYPPPTTFEFTPSLFAGPDPISVSYTVDIDDTGFGRGGAPVSGTFVVEPSS
jgi:hypothetical protein